MSERLKIALDAMGGDNAPEAIIKGAVMSLENPKIELILVGKEDIINEELKKHDFDEKRISVVNATEIITNEDTPTSAIKNKKDSSIVVGLNMVKRKECDGFVSAGNTGALLTGATVIVGRIKGIDRPALGTNFPNNNGFSFLLDVGANVDAKPNYLLQFAKMGSVYMNTIMGIESPKVGLINIGAEAEKGNSLTKEVYGLLKEDTTINFLGNIEPRDIPKGEADVLVCDAFVGNVIIKLAEGLMGMMLGKIKSEMMKKMQYKIGAALSGGAFKEIKKSFDYDDLGGAPFIGLNSLVVKAHGSSNERAIKGAINQCFLANQNDLVGKLKEKL